MPGAVPDFIPVVGRYRTTATWRLSFHCGMNAADTSAWQGASSLRVTSSRVRCGPLVLLPLQMRETLGAQPRRLIAVTNQPMRVMLAANHPSDRSGDGEKRRSARGLCWPGPRRQNRTGAYGGASGNAPGSGTAELTKLEIRPDLDHDEIAGWRRRGHRDADARRGAW